MNANIVIFLFLPFIITAEINSAVLDITPIRRCHDDDFICDNGECIRQAYMCNNVTDCLDKTDEIDCDKRLCLAPQWFRCKSDGSCISSSYVCNNKEDCPGGEDEERDCANHKVHHISPACASDEFRCKDTMCIPNVFVCDGTSHCMDDSDELDGCIEIEKKCKGFLCKNRKCLRNTDSVCDGNDDCGDNSDEENCPLDCHASNNKFLCKDLSVCLDFEKVCNSKKDCPDGSDEGPKCFVNKTQICLDLNCTQYCHISPTGAECSCTKGFIYNKDKNDCVDINECDIYGICSQGCYNTIGSYRCSCVDKFALLDDNKTCHVKGTEPLMLYALGENIKGMFLHTKIKTNIADDLNHAIGVSFDGKHIYWTDIQNQMESIVRSREDGSQLEMIVASGLGQPEDLFLDWLTGNIYFTDAVKQHVAVCSNMGFYCKSLITDNVDSPRGIALFPQLGILYYSDWSKAKPKIVISGMDGKGVKDFVKDNIHYPTGLTLDWPNERLYWVDAKYRTIESIHMTGKDRKIVLAKTKKHPYGIAVFEDRIYWSDIDSKRVESCNKFNGKKRKIELRDKTAIYDIHIYHSAIQPYSNDHPCMNNKCSHLCLIGMNNSFSCECPHNMNLREDKKTCQEIIKTETIVVGADHDLMVIDHQEFGRHQQGHALKLKLFISQLAYNSLDGTMYIADNVQRVIFEIHDQLPPMELISENIGNVSAMDFDYLGNNLYWADTERNTIEVYSIRTRKRTIVYHYSGTDRPIALAVIPEIGKFFVALRSYYNTHIDKQSMDGRGDHNHIIEEGLSNTGKIVFAVDRKDSKIFWSDMGSGNIEMTNYDGSKREIIKSSIVLPSFVTIIGRDIFWGIFNETNIYWSNLNNKSLTKRMILTDTQFNSELVMTKKTQIQITKHICQTKNGGCSHICVPLGLSYGSCLCPVGMTFNNNKNQTCTEVSNCEFRCKSGECLSSSKRCNTIVDCADHSDEFNCSYKDKSIICSYDQFKCNNNEKCIPLSRRCDMHVDCTDNSDEKDCLGFNHTSKCHKNQYACPEGLCIDVTALCDGFNDCLNGTDEKDCSVKAVCNYDQFKCSSGQCLDKRWECDGSIDCYDGSDEHSKCDKQVCQSNQFKCKSEKCINRRLVCDGIDDCGDNSDEESCEKEYKCRGDKDKIYQCTSNKKICLKISAKCNGTAECPGGEDETNCTNCNSREFQCDDGSCILNIFRCDNEADCPDKSDEKDCDKTDSLSCPPHMFDCKNGDCIDYSRVCDGNSDCVNNLDELGMCNKSCIDHPCDHNCRKTPSGPVCSCTEGFRLAGNMKNCIDIDECHEDTPCAQRCDNMDGSYRCSCYNGFLMKLDKMSCKSVGKSAYYLYSTFDQIRLADKNTLDILISADANQITSMDVNVDKEIIYFTVEDSGTIFSLNLKNNSKHNIKNIGAPGKVSIDWITDNIYFVDSGISEQSINVCHMEDESCSRIIKFSSHEIVTAMTVDGLNQLIFFTLKNSWNYGMTTSTLYRINLDGTRLEIILKSIPLVSDLAIDLNKRNVYFISIRSKSVGMVRYDGSYNKTVIKDSSEISRPISLTIFENEAYIINTGSSKLTKCLLYGDFSCKPTDIVNVQNTNNFIISQESNQKRIQNPCHQHNCSFMCVQASSNQPKCLCHDGIYVQPNVSCNESVTAIKSIFVKQPYVQQDTSTSEILTGIFFSILCIGLVCTAIYFYYKKRLNHGKFNVSMHFQNPGLNVEESEVSMCHVPKIVSTKTQNEISFESNYWKSVTGFVSGFKKPTVMEDCSDSGSSILETGDLDNERLIY